MPEAPRPVKNSYFGGSSSEDYFYSGGTLNKTNCASSDTSADDTGANETSTGYVNSVPHSTATFANVTAGSEDYSLVSGSALIGAGTDTSGESAPLNFTVDIIGTTRS